MAAVFSRHGAPLNGDTITLNNIPFTPFSLFLPPDSRLEPEIHCLRLLRDLPGKRQVYLGQWGDQQIVAKVFVPHKRAGRYWQREERGITIMVQRGILTPEILYSGPLDHGAGLVIILPFVAHAETLLEKWISISNTRERIKILSLLMTVLSDHHQAGLIQGDLHLGNFLLAKEQIYTLDGSDITVYRQSVGLHKSVDNLGLLGAQFFPEDDKLVENWLQMYCRFRNFAYNENLLQKLKTRIAVQRHKRKKKVLRKIFRECSAVVFRQDGSRRMFCLRRHFTASMAVFLDDPEKYLAEKNVELLKDGNSSTVMGLTIGNTPMVVKRYNIKGLFHGLRRSIARTRASRSWENAHLLEFYGFRTAGPVAMVEYRRGLFPRTSYFIAEYVDGASCADFFKDFSGSEAKKEKAAKAVVDVLLQLRRLHISHGDLKAGNIIMTDRGPVVIDLDSLREHRFSISFKKFSARDLERFQRNWENDQELHGLFSRLLKNQGNDS